MIITVCCCN